MTPRPYLFFFFFFNDTATTEIYTLSLHDALPISGPANSGTLPFRYEGQPDNCGILTDGCANNVGSLTNPRSEEHTSELQSQSNLVCRLLLEKKKKKRI